MNPRQTNTRRRAARFTAAHPLINAGFRKGAVRSHPRFQYSTEMEKLDEMDFARSTLSSGSSRPVTCRDSSSDLRSIANVQKLSMLQEVYPEMAIDVLEDVLIAAQFRIDVAASMLGDVTREMLDSPEGPDVVVVDWTPVQHADEWHEVAESRPGMEHWVMVHDDWEVVDADAASPQKTTRSYADVLATNACQSSETTVARSPVISTSASTSLAPLVRQPKKLDDDDEEMELEELSVKSFGARKRRSSRKFRG